MTKSPDREFNFVDKSFRKYVNMGMGLALTRWSSLRGTSDSSMIEITQFIFLMTERFQQSNDAYHDSL